MATRGKENWLKNWKGNDSLSVKVRVSSPYYQNESSNKAEGTLVLGEEVIYKDSYSQHIEKGGNTKIGFQFGPNDQEVYYAKIDSFIKPGRSENIKLNPSSFGLSNKTYSNVIEYYNTLIREINNRWASEKLNGELYDYLMELIKYANGGSFDVSDIDTSSFDWGEIQSYFAEVIGPLACIKISNLLSSLGISTSNASIFIPPDSETLYDYKVIINPKEYLISAKSGRGVSNQIKPQFVIQYLTNITQILRSSKAYQLLEILAEKSVKQGPFFGWKLLQTNNALTDVCIADIIQNYNERTRSDSKISNPDIWKAFVKAHMNVSKIEDVTYGQLRFTCEKLINEASKIGVLQRDLKTLFEIFLNVSRVIYVKLTVKPPSGNPSFNVINIQGVQKFTYVEIRSSNDSKNRTSDRMGYDKVR
jgi:hypothetical protein